MKRITLAITLLMTALFAVASPTYAYSGEYAKIIEQDGKIYTGIYFPRNEVTELIDGELGSPFGYYMQDLDVEYGVSYLTYDLTTWSGYDASKAYNLYVYEQGNLLATELNLLHFMIEQDSEMEYWVHGSNDNKSISTFIQAQNDAISIYWEEVSIDDSAPVLDGQTAFVTTVDDPITETEIRSFISAVDETDGNLTHLIELAYDHYSANASTIGSYEIGYEVEDNAGNVATLTVTVLVKDILAPVADDDSITISYTNNYDLTDYMDSLIWTDNYDGTFDGSYSLVESNDYSANWDDIGSWEVVLSAEDSSGNVGYMILTINVIDDVEPTFSGPTTLSKPSNETLTLSEIKDQLTANDAIDGSLTSSIEVVTDNYTGHGNTVGSYDIQFSVTDTSGNIAYHTVTIEVYDNLPPVFYVRDGYFISVSEAVSLSLEDIKDILIATGQLESDGTGGVELSAIYNEYSGNENEPGIYALTLEGASASGNEYIFNLAIEVTEDEGEPDVIADDLPWYEDFYNENTDLVHAIGAGIIVILLVVGTVAYFKHKK